ncbi:MAG: hypothetical protein WA375_07830, partial [Pseudolabrys sp.]
VVSAKTCRTLMKEVELDIDTLKRIAAAYLGLKMAPGTAPGRRGEAEMRKLRHASREQEYRRDVEMREAVKAAEERALRAWRDSRPHFPFAKEGHQTTKGMGTGAWFLMGLENSNPRRRARGTRSIRIFFGCAGS